MDKEDVKQFIKYIQFILDYSPGFIITTDSKGKI